MPEFDCREQHNPSNTATQSTTRCSRGCLGAHSSRPTDDVHAGSAVEGSHNQAGMIKAQSIMALNLCIEPDQPSSPAGCVPGSSSSKPTSAVAGGAGIDGDIRLVRHNRCP